MLPLKRIRSLNLYGAHNGKRKSVEIELRNAVANQRSHPSTRAQDSLKIKREKKERRSDINRDMVVHIRFLSTAGN